MYECPELDSGKELVLWRPEVNWESHGSPLTAARALNTVHGTGLFVKH